MSKRKPFRRRYIGPWPTRWMISNAWFNLFLNEICYWFWIKRTNLMAVTTDRAMALKWHLSKRGREGGLPESRGGGRVETLQGVWVRGRGQHKIPCMVCVGNILKNHFSWLKYSTRCLPSESCSGNSSDICLLTSMWPLDACLIASRDGELTISWSISQVKRVTRVIDSGEFQKTVSWDSLCLPPASTRFPAFTMPALGTWISEAEKRQNYTGEEYGLRLHPFTSSLCPT